jgi:hypothetical protein
VGWQYLTFNIWTLGNVTGFEGYYVCDDVTLAKPSYNATTVYKSVFLFTDDNLNWLTVGGMAKTTTTSTENFIGII